MGYSKSRLVNLSEQRKIALLKDTLGDCYNKGSELLFHCPKCEHHKKKLSVNLDKSVFKCWVCDWSGRNIYRIIRRYGSTNARYEWKSFNDQIEIENFNEKMFGKSDVGKKEAIELPKSFISLTSKNLSSTSVLPLNYLNGRGITKEDILKWKIGYCPTGKYAGRVVIPSFDVEGNLNYFVTRAYDNDWKKYLNPKTSRDIVFNHLYLDFDEPLTIVEGVFDAIKAGENSVPLLGSTLTETSFFFQELIKNDTPVYLALDPDAEHKTNKLINLLLKYDVEVNKINVAPFDDVGEMTKREFEARKQSAVFLDSDNYLLSRIIGI